MGFVSALLTAPLLKSARVRPFQFHSVQPPGTDPLEREGEAHEALTEITFLTQRAVSRQVKGICEATSVKNTSSHARSE